MEAVCTASVGAALGIMDLQSSDKTKATARAPRRGAKKLLAIGLLDPERRRRRREDRRTRKRAAKAAKQQRKAAKVAKKAARRSERARPAAWQPRRKARPMAALVEIFQQEDLNFLVTNRIPRRWATLFMGWFSRIESPLVARTAIALWRRMSPELDLSDALEPRFRSLRDCFTRELLPGSRPIDLDPSVATSPCDARIGAFGRVRGIEAFQVKGFPYTLADLLPDPSLVERFRDGWFVTLRLQAHMYHRFHAPCDCRLDEVQYVSGDTWNVNPIALRRVERLFCKNERAVLDLRLPDPRQGLLLVPVAAILVASIKLHCLSEPLHLRYRGPNRIACSAAYVKGEELGYFQHGSTVLCFASPDLVPCETVREGALIRVGEPLFRGLRP